MDQRRVGTRSRKLTEKFCFDASHNLYSEKTRKCEENTAKKVQNNERQKRFYCKQKEKKNAFELAQLKATVKKLKRKIVQVTKKIAQKK